jgi:hypothetical protein
MKIKQIILISLTFLGLLLSPNHSRAGESIDTSVTSNTITVSGTISAPLLAILQTPVTTTNPGAGLQICYGTSTTTISNCSSTFYADNQSGNTVTIQNDGVFSYTISNLSPNTNYSIDVLRTDTGASVLSGVLQAQTADTSVSLDPGATPAPTCTAGTDGYCLLAPISGLSVIHDTDLPNYFNLIYKVGIGLAAVLALIMLFFGGIQYMSTDALSGKTDGKKKMSNALLGLLLALGSYAILNTINPKLLNFTFGIDSVDVAYDPPANIVFSSGGGASGVSNISSNITIYDSLLAQAAQSNGVECTLMKAFMITESGGNPNAQSGVGAIGLLQLMPATAQALSVDPATLTDPGININAGTQLVKQLMTTACNGGLMNSVCNVSNLDYVIAAYNAGPGSNKKARLCPTQTLWQCVDYPGYAETRNYVPKVKANYDKLKLNNWGC